MLVQTSYYRVERRAMFLALTLLSLCVSRVDAGLGISTDSWHRLFPNVSLGLGRDGMKDQCDEGGNRLPSVLSSPKSLGYTPNRRVQSETLDAANLEHLQLAFVLAMGGHDEGPTYNYGNGGSKNGLTAVWDSWVKHFFSQTSNTTSLIMLLDERDFNKQNHTKVKEKYVDILLRDNLGAEPVECVKLHPNRMDHHHGGSYSTRRRSRNRHPNCDNKLLLDQTYFVYSFEMGKYSNSTEQAPLIIFVAVHNFPRPTWAEGQDEDTLYIHWRPKGLPPRFNTNYGYTKMTNWYAYHMLNLQILDYFDYAGKLDNDVSFAAPFPERNLPRRLASKNRKMLVTQQQWYYDDPRIANGVEWCLHNYVKQQSVQCGIPEKEATRWLQPAGGADSTFWESNFNTTFRAHFLVFWLGLYAAPEVKSMAKFWNDFGPHGMWHFRWGDQQWWPRPIAMFDGDPLSTSIDHYRQIDTENGKFVVHKAYPLSATLKDVPYFSWNGSTPEQRQQLYKSVYGKYVYR